MKPRHKSYKNDHSTPPSHHKTTQIPITSPPNPSVHSAATKIQATFKTHITKTLFKKISAVNSSATKLQTLIQLQETVDTIRSNDQERIKLNETLMGLLLVLDSVPGWWDPNIRDLRRNVSRRIVGLQEILDGVTCSRTQNWDDSIIWDEVVEKMERDVCEERGGGFEMERFCAEKLGFRCLQRFLRDQ